MTRGGWSFFATVLRGDGTETLAAADLPLTSPTVTTTLSGTDEISFDLTPEIARLRRPDGRPVMRARSTAVYAVLDGVARAGGIVRSSSAQGHVLRVACHGFTSYLDGLPWTNTTRKLYGWDPADVARLIWQYAQSHPLGNLGVVISPEVKTRARVGRRVAEVKNAAGETVTEAVDEPVLLANYATHDLADTFHEMCDVGSIDYRETHRLDGDQVRHELALGAPRLGRRRTDIAFQLGVNVAEQPAFEFDDDEYASEVLVVGAGEGDKMLRAHAYVPGADRVRRVQVIAEKGIGRLPTIQAAAAKYARWLNLEDGDVDELVIAPHPLAPIGSWENGDEVFLSGDGLWAGPVAQWVRVLSTTYAPSEHAGATVKVVRADKT